MRAVTIAKAVQSLVLTGLMSSGAVFAQGTSATGPSNRTLTQALPSAAATTGQRPLDPAPGAVPPAEGSSCDPGAWTLWDRPGALNSWYGGAEFLWMRTHFSEALAFVRQSNTLTPTGLVRQTTAQELNFAYDPSFRVFLGYRLDPTTSVRLTYWYFDTHITENGVGQPTVTLIDPFGNKATAGQSAQTFAGVRLNVYDLDYVKSGQFWGLSVFAAAGARIADITQSYSALESAASGVGLTQGDFKARFVGAGPHLQLGAYTWSSPQSRFSLYGKTDLAVLLGQYDVNATAIVAGARVGQSASRALTTPVVGGELGVAWRPLPNLTLSAGWQVQAWFDLGTSGGQFAGNFIPVDDSNIMAFDGFVFRAMFQY